MKKSLILGSLALGTTAITAGTFMGLYIHEANKNDDKNASFYMQQIVDKINAIPGVKNILTVKKYQEDVKKRVAANQTMQEATIDILKEKIAESHDAALLHITNGRDSHNLLKNEVNLMQTNLDSELDEIKSGLIGEHDLNYYKTVLDDSVRTSQFDTLTSGLDNFKTDTEADIDAIVKDIDSNKHNIDEIKSGLTKLTKATDGKYAKMVDKIVDVKNELNLTIGRVETGTTDKFTSLKVETDAAAQKMIDSINGVATNAATNSEAIIGLKSNLEHISTRLDNNSFTIQELKGMYNNFLEDKAETDLELEDLTNVIDRVNSLAEQNGKVTAALGGKAIAFEKSFDDVNDQLALVGYNYQVLENRVTKNEDEISKLWSKLKNTDDDMNTKLKKIDDNMIGLDSSITDIFNKNFQLEKEFKENISLNTASMDSLKTNIDDLKNGLDASNTGIQTIKDEMSLFGKAIDNLRDSIATVLTDVDLLTTKVDDNAADIYGLRARIDALERNNHSKTSDLLYISNNPHNKVGKYFYSPFYLGQSFSKYRKLQIEYYDGHSRRQGSIDIPVVNNGRGILYFNSGDRSHPNRSWFGFKMNYSNNSIQLSYYFTAGNASWSWHSNRWAIVAKSIRGIYK